MKLRMIMRNCRKDLLLGVVGFISRGLFGIYEVQILIFSIILKEVGYIVILSQFGLYKIFKGKSRNKMCYDVEKGQLVFMIFVIFKLEWLFFSLGKLE